MTKNCCKYFTVSLVPVASLTLAVLFAMGIVVLPILYVHLANQYKYGIVIDAGSSHTHMFFYRWNIPKDRDTGDIEEIRHCHVSKSLNSYTSNPDKAGDFVERCIDKSHTKKFIPKSQWGVTQLFLGATAGMRLVNRSNHTLSEEILTNVNESLEENSGYHLSSGRIITGQEEAVAGWVAGNFLSGGLEKSGGSLTGSLDLGGASAEIAFQHPSSGRSEYETTVRLFNKDHPLYARSYLCYGLNEARWRLLAHLANSALNAMEEIHNPCMLNGARLTYQTDEIFSLCVRNETSSDVFGYGYSPSDEASNYTFIGTGEPANCSKIIHEVFNVTKCKDSGVCINTTYLWPPVNNTGTFLGMSGFYDTAEFFNNSGIELHNLTSFNQSVQVFCALTNQNASRMYPQNPYLQELCFDGVFSLFLLQTGFSFNSSNTGWTLKFLKQGDRKSRTVGWAMGYLLNQTTIISNNPHQVQRPFRTVDLIVGILVLSILCVVFIVFFFLTFHACRKVLKTRGGYSHIS